MKFWSTEPDIDPVTYSTDALGKLLYLLVPRTEFILGYRR